MSGIETADARQDEARPPRHVAIIMDGNGRWAAARGLPRVEGHRRGVEAVRRTVRAGVDLGNGIVWFREGGTRRLEVPTGSDTDLAVEAFLEAVRSGRLPEASVDVALEASLTAVLCQHAIDVGATVGWNDVVSST